MSMFRYVWLILWAWSMLAVAQETQQRPHAYAFDNPELVSTQRVFGVGNATVMLGGASATFPEAVASYAAWLTRNQATLTAMTDALAIHYRIPVADDGLRLRVAKAMHLKTALDLSAAKQDEVCPTLPASLALPSLDLQQRYRETLAEVRAPNYLSPKLKAATAPKPAVVTEASEEKHD
ncbi:MAG: hypothetical protein ACR2IJ_00670 [Fluviibacter sp.]